MTQHHLNIRILKFIFISLFIANPLYGQFVNLIDENTPMRVLVPDATVASTWRSNIGFSDSKWIAGSGGIGFGSGYSQYININADKMYVTDGSGAKTCMVRMKFNVTEEQLARARRFVLYIRYDDGYAMYLNAGLISSRNAPIGPKFNSSATAGHNAGADPEAINLIYNTRFQVWNSAINILRPGENLLAIQGFNSAPDDPDFLLTIKLVLETFGDPPVVQSSNLPIIKINTTNEVAPNGRVIANMQVIDNGPGQPNNINDTPNDYDGRIAIEIHGSSSASFPKKSFNVETQDAEGNNNNVSLLGLPKENDWVLYSYYSDKTLMRDVLMYQISNSIGRYASRSRYCEVFLDGYYYGVFSLLEKVKQDKNRVDIPKLDEDDLAGDSLTGGYIIKIDRPAADNAFFNSAYPPFPGSGFQVRYEYHYPKPDDIKEEQRAYIKGFIDAFELAMDSPGYADTATGYPKYLDIASFVDYMLLTELCKNVDGYRLSTYFYKEKDSKGGKLYAGPIWDMNFSLGNAGYYGSDSVKAWEVDELCLGEAIRTDNIFPPSWWAKLFHEPAFASQLAQRWHQLRADLITSSKIEAVIDSIGSLLMEAQERNFKIFSGPGDAGQGFWVTPYIFYTFNTYQDETDYLKYWINNRIQWMDENISRLTGISEKSRDMPGEFSLEQNYPNPFNPATKIEYRLPEAGTVNIKVFDILGRESATIVSETKEAGYYTVNFDGSKLASGVYFARLIVEPANSKPFTKTIKMLMTK